MCVCVLSHRVSVQPQAAREMSNPPGGQSIVSHSSGRMYSLRTQQSLSVWSFADAIGELVRVGSLLLRCCSRGSSFTGCLLCACEEECG